MHFNKIAVSAFLTVASVAAEGINCEGSGDCMEAGGGNAMGDIQTVIQGALGTNGGDFYNTGVQIACHCTGEGPGAVCAFFQNGASGTLSDASGFIQQLQDHDCTNCGSVPTQPGNDVSTGELTVNAVADAGACCTGKNPPKGNYICAPA